MPLLLTFIILFLAGLHLYKNWRIQPHSLFLSGALMFISFYFVVHYLFIYGISAFWLAVFYGHGTPVHYLIGPLIFFYVRGVLTDHYRLRRRDLWHFLPALLDLIFRIPYFLKPWSFKIWMAGELVEDIRRVHDFVDVFFPSSYFSLPVRVASMIGYTVYSLGMLRYFRRNYSDRTRVPLQSAKTPIRFLQYFLAVCLIAETSIFILLVMFLTDKSMASIQVIQNPLLVISFLGILSIPLIIQMHPEVLYGIPKWRSEVRDTPALAQEHAEGHHAVDESENDEPSAESLNKFRVMAEQISVTMEKGKLYLQPDFSLEDLARAMDVPKHHLYYCFNHILQKRFTQLRAELRIQYACEQIRKGATEKKTLEAIGIESGFSSRSTFIMAFRECTGMTPSEFQRSLEEA